MLWWLVDNSNLVLLLLVLAALLLGVSWWLTRRGAYLFGLGGVVALMVVVWVLSLLIVTDRKRLVLLVHDVEQQINKRDLAGAFNHFAEDAELVMDGQRRARTREAILGVAKMVFQKGRIEGIKVWDVEVEKVDRPSAVVTFYVRPTDEQSYARCEAQCVLHGERSWRVKVLKIDLPPGGRPWLGIPR
jgi:hypothetical protein